MEDKGVVIIILSIYFSFPVYHSSVCLIFCKTNKKKQQQKFGKFFALLVQYFCVLHWKVVKL